MDTNNFRHSQLYDILLVTQDKAVSDLRQVTTPCMCLMPRGVDKFFFYHSERFLIAAESEVQLVVSLIVDTIASSCSYESASGQRQLLHQGWKGIMSGKCSATLLCKLIVFLHTNNVTVDF